MKKAIKQHIGVLVGVVFYYTLMYTLQATCLFKYFTGHKCLTCGVTRAMCSLIRLDFRGYVYFQPLALLIVAAVLLFIHRKLFKGKVWINIFCISVLVADMIWYIINF